jgi:hypothetical protein
MAASSSSNPKSTINNQQSSFLPLTSDLSDLSDLFICRWPCQLRLRHYFPSSLPLTPRSTFNFAPLRVAMPVSATPLFS